MSLEKKVENIFLEKGWSGQSAYEASKITVEELSKRDNEWKDIVNLILPLARGYAAENKIKSNQAYLAIAEKAVKKQ